MKPRLVELLRCPECRSALHLERSVTEPSGVEILEGALVCRSCGAMYTICDGIPRLHTVASPDATRPRTSSSFGYLWARSVPGGEVYEPALYHFAKMEKSLSLDPPRGLVLDAGCGDGIDLANQARREGVEAIGVELSDGGCRTSFLRTRGLARAHVVQADLCRLPFADGTFDMAYSYGVLHHLGVPELGLREIVRAVKPGARVLAYLYEDFSERSATLRAMLTAANACRAITTRLPHRVLYGLCRLMSPTMFALFTLPAIVGRRVPRLAPLAERLPFRHGTGPFSLVGDLYDRFSAPVERRYSRAQSVAFFVREGLERVTIAAERGWMVGGLKTGDRAAE